MKRNIDMNEISDGKLYTSADMVKVDCHGCPGCSDCCHGMGNSIVLDPMDIYRLQKAVGADLNALISRGFLELNMVDGMILPNLRMNEKNDACSFLNDEGRCSVHAFRPGICRLFPLGRIYDEGGFKYFLQIHECSCDHRSKMKTEKWIGIPKIKLYESYIYQWHCFLKECQDAMQELQEEHAKILITYVLRVFYQTPYQAATDDEFYREWKARMDKLRSVLNME